MNPRITVIDDEPAYLSLIEAFSAASFIECVQFSAWQNDLTNEMSVNDLLLLDIHMPGVDGIDVLMELKRANYLGGLIIMSGADESVIASTLTLGRSLGLNILGSLQKPFRLAAFKKLVQTFLDSAKTTKPVPEIIQQDFTEAQLEQGVEEGWIYPVFQPQINSANGQVVGLECLSRVNHPTHGILPAFQFIGKLSELNLINQYTVMLIKKAIDCALPTLKEFTKLTVSFNFSSKALSSEFTSILIELFRSYDIAPARITLEITESSAIHLTPEALYAVTKFRAHGFNLSIDDYGTGYSTIKLLNELPFNELKVDRSFIIDITSHKKSEEIVKSIAELSHNLGYKLVIEGVETNKQLHLLNGIGCRVIQGYFYCKPMTIDGLRAFVEHSDVLEF
jgi:EAL domain-containing protein (putative c-di-GMP-specific phosphodiesterase class I)/CheY-like chemotaxis protein